jgi:ribonucleotide monophosphatase NagD (HAD superfamily)
VIGKPFVPLFEAVCGEAGAAPVVGRPAQTDIEGPEARLGPMLVLTGVSSRADVEATGVRPNVIAEDVSALLDDP